jgi:hypothetical protein
MVCSISVIFNFFNDDKLEEFMIIKKILIINKSKIFCYFNFFNDDKLEEFIKKVIHPETIDPYKSRKYSYRQGVYHLFWHMCSGVPWVYLIYCLWLCQKQ